MAARGRSRASYITGLYGSKKGRRVRSVTVFEPGVWSGKDAQVKFRFARPKTGRHGWVSVTKVRDLPPGSVAAWLKGRK